MCMAPRIRFLDAPTRHKAAGLLRVNRQVATAVFATPGKLGLEGIVSKRKDSPYRSGRSPHWLKSKNPACEAAHREAEEDWGR